MTVFTACANAPRLVRVGGVTYRVSAATLRDLAELVAFVEDNVPPPEGSACAPFSSEAAQDALFGPAGLPLLVFLALRRHQPGVTFEAASDVAIGSGAGEVQALAAAFFNRRERPKGESPGVMRDLTALAWGRQAFRVAEDTGYTLDEIFAMSLDQYDVVVSRGKSDDTWEGKDLSMDEVQRVYRANVGEAPEPPPAADVAVPAEAQSAIDRLNGAKGLRIVTGGPADG